MQRDEKRAGSSRQTSMAGALTTDQRGRRAPAGAGAFGLAVLACTAGGACVEARLRPDATEPPARIVVREGTALYFDVTPDGGAIVIDLLGQLWAVPVEGGRARPLTDAVHDTADDRQPAISPDGRWIATRSDRPAGRGIWIHEVGGGGPRQVTDSAFVLGGDEGVPAWSRDGRRLVHHRRGRIFVSDIRTRTTSELALDSLDGRGLDEPCVSPDGRRLLVSGPWAAGSARALLESAPGAPIWEIDLESGAATRLTGDGVPARAPAYDPDGGRVAYFAREGGSFQLYVRTPDGETRVLAAEPGIEPRRVRWSPDGAELYFVAAGRLRTVPARGGPSREIPFVAELELPRTPRARGTVAIPSPGDLVPARGFGGLALAPDGSRVALLALGRLWVADFEGPERAVAAVPPSAARLHWSPDGRRLVWSDGVHGEDDLWLTDVASGVSRRLTRMPGVEDPIGWSSGGDWIAFVHAADETRIRAVRPDARDATTARDLGPLPWIETAAFGAPYAWLPHGDTLLVYGMDHWPVAGGTCVAAALVTLDGEAHPLTEFPCRPAMVTLAADGSLIGVERGLLTRYPRTEGGWGAGRPLGDVPALNPSAARDGALLYVAPHGLRLRSPDGTERSLGWPIRFRVPAYPPLLLRNARIVALDGESTDPADILIVDARIRAIGAAGTLSLPPGAGDAMLDAAGRWVLPGLIDTHLHFYDTDVAVPRDALRHGITTIRDMWGRLGVAAAFRDAVDAGVLAGARIVVSGPPVYPSPRGVPVTSDFLWIAVDSGDAERALALLAGLGAGHVKMRYAQTWAGGADFVRRAHARGLPVSGHCAHGLPAILAGIDGLEHADGQCGEWEFGLRDDLVQVFRAAGIATAPIIGLHAEIARRDSDQREPAAIAALERREKRARDHARRLHAGGARLIAGSDAQAFPGSLHGELESLVAAGLSPRAALLAATRDAADAIGLGRDLGRIRVGHVADLLLLDGDPLEDIRNTRRIYRIIQGGRIVEPAPRNP